jgi:hypothetical protein
LRSVDALANQCAYHSSVSSMRIGQPSQPVP